MPKMKSQVRKEKKRVWANLPQHGLCLWTWDSNRCCPAFIKDRLGPQRTGSRCTGSSSEGLLFVAILDLDGLINISSPTFSTD